MQMMIRMPNHSRPVSIIEKFSASILLTFCILPDESISEQLKVLFPVYLTFYIYIYISKHITLKDIVPGVFLGVYLVNHFSIVWV